MLAMAGGGVFVGVVPTVGFGDRIPGQVRSTAYQSQLYAAAGWTRLAERAGDGQGEEPVLVLSRERKWVFRGFLWLPATSCGTPLPFDPVPSEWPRVAEVLDVAHRLLVLCHFVF